MSTHFNLHINKLIGLAILLALLLGACSSAAATPQANPGFAGKSASDLAPAAPAAPAELNSAGQVSTSIDSSVPQQSIQRIVIVNASLSLVVADPEQSMDRIRQMASDMGGYVVSANLSQTQLDNGGQAPQATIKIRVPAERLNEALNKIKSESNRPPLSESQDSQDVTSDYTDLQSRLRNLQNTEQQLTKIMDAATKTEDVLSVYNQLTQVRGQIEVIQGQIKYYDESAALSAINVDLIPNAAVQPLTIGGWQPAGVARNAVQALINTVKVLANIAIWAIIYVLPVFLVLYIVIFLPLSLIWRAWRRRRARNKAASQMQIAGTANPPSGEPPVQ
jgi:PBP1b-binding outer membrane lipoprotein LpoB